MGQAAEPVRPDQPPPADTGLIPLTVPEADNCWLDPPPRPGADQAPPARWAVRRTRPAGFEQLAAQPVRAPASTVQVVSASTAGVSSAVMPVLAAHPLEQHLRGPGIGEPAGELLADVGQHLRRNLSRAKNLFIAADLAFRAR